MADTPSTPATGAGGLQSDRAGRPGVTTAQLAAARATLIEQLVAGEPDERRATIADAVVETPDSAVVERIDRQHWGGWAGFLQSLAAPTGETAGRGRPGAAEGELASPVTSGAWRRWDEARLDLLRAGFEAEGWTRTERRRYSDAYELDLGDEHVAVASVPHCTDARDTDRRAWEAAKTLVMVSGHAHLEIGPLSEREEAWARRAQLASAACAVVRTPVAQECPTAGRAFGSAGDGASGATWSGGVDAHTC